MVGQLDLPTQPLDIHVVVNNIWVDGHEQEHVIGHSRDPRSRKYDISWSCKNEFVRAIIYEERVCWHRMQMARTGAQELAYPHKTL